ncbi:MAG: DNA primase [Verrucomicrobia bacterium]|nr:DNA primase [Verrucomicrobiota bacterium]MBU1734612.1 DNA primase [Verrucomicrobiota bacterium]MBU1857831.1 DNA primase [Verrucomicrobiota bacterium]
MPLKVPHAVLEEIRLNNDVATVIGAYFTLQRSGSTFKALCPFHKEKTPSFMVNPQRQTYHCFGCGVGGDVFRFVMDYEKVDFMTAVKMLAQRAGIRLKLESDGDNGQPGKEALYEINALVAKLYQQFLLKHPEGEAARKYLALRDLPASTIEEFMIGFAPERWDTILRWAEKKYTREQLEAAGLIIPARPRPEVYPPEFTRLQGGAVPVSAEALRAGKPKATRDPTPTVGSARWYDRFRNRLMFPIQDEQGRVVGFSGRVLAAEVEAAKYVNTPETVLFRKGHILYALHKARRAIVESREAIVCEGQIDVIRCHLAGFSTAVAAQGTAFTADHARILKRYADSIVLVFDADRAGQDAALRAADTFLQVGLVVRIAALPAGEDPDSLIRRKDGTVAFKKLLQDAKSALDFQIDVLTGREKPDTEAGLMRLATAVVATIARTPNAVQQARLIQQAAARLAVPETALQHELDKVLRHSRPVAVVTAPQKADPAMPRPNKELALAEHLATNLELAGLVRTYLPLDLLTDLPCRQVIQACLQAEQGKRDVMSIIAEQDNEERDLSRFVAQALAAPAKIKSDFATREESVKSLILGIRTAALQRRRKEIAKQCQAMRVQVGSKQTPAEEKKLDLEYTQLGYDIAKLKQWDTAVPVMDGM